MQSNEIYEHDFYIMRHAKSINIQGVITFESVSVLELLKSDFNM